MSLNGGNFKGFLIQAVDGNNNPIGSFNPPSNGKCLACGSNCDSITHTNSRTKNRVVATWNAPSNYAGTAYFRYSIASSYSTYWAAVNGQINVAKILLDARAEPNITDTHGETLLNQVAAKGHTDMVILLLKSGADPKIVDACGKTPLHWAAYNGQLDICWLILQNVEAKNGFDS